MRFLKIISYCTIVLLGITLIISPVSSDIPDYVIKYVGEPGSGIGQLNGPYSIIKIDNQYYVSDFENDRIQVFDENWEYSFQFNHSGQMDAPRGLEYNGTHLFVAETVDDEVSIFYKNGTFVDSFGQTGSNAGDFTEPRGIEIANGVIFVSDTNDRVQLFDENTLTYIDTIADDSSINFSSDPDGLLYLDGLLYVAANGNGSINIYDAVDGRPYGSIGSAGRGIDQLFNPSGIQYKNGYFIISSTSTDYISIFDTQGNFVQRIILPTATNPLWNAPEFMLLEDHELHIPLFFEDKLISLRIVGEPTSLGANTGANSISLNWQPDNDKGFTPAISYEIFRDDGSGYEHLATTEDQFYTDFSVTKDKVYTYSIMANSVIGTSENATLSSLSLPNENSETSTEETVTVTNELTETVTSTDTETISTTGGLPLSFPFVTVVLILMTIKTVKQEKHQP